MLGRVIDLGCVVYQLEHARHDVHRDLIPRLEVGEVLGALPKALSAVLLLPVDEDDEEVDLLKKGVVF